jgi:ATP-dependent Clp protease ATP-binding subunit ClpA
MRFDKYTQKAQAALLDAQGLAENYNHPTIDPEHLLLALVRQEGGVVPAVLMRIGVEPGQLEHAVVQALEAKPRASGATTQVGMGRESSTILREAEQIAANMKDEYVSAEHLLMAIASSSGRARDLLTRHRVDYNAIMQALAAVRGSQRVTSDNPEAQYEALTKYGRDLTDDARKGKLDPVIGRDEQIRRVIQILSRRTKNNPVLIGEPGVGKTAIVEGLAQKIIKGDIPETLKDKRVISLDLGSMLAGTKFRGEFEKRLKKVMKEIADAQREVILFIDELHTVVGAGAAEGAVDASNLLKPALARGEMQAVGATTLNEYRKHIEKDPALERRFQPVLVSEPSVEDSVQILHGLRDRYEAHHKVKISKEAIASAVHLSDRYLKERFLPDKAIDLIDEAAAKVRLLNLSAPEKMKELEGEIKKIKQEREATKHTMKSKMKTKKIREFDEKLTKLKKELEDIKMAWQRDKGTSEPVVLASDIEEIVSKWTGVPVTQLAEQEIDKLLKLEERLHERVIGQDRAVTAVAEAVRRGRAGLKDPNRPLGSFIFLGPTGVGKTELTKALAELLFGDEDALIRVDMSEYMESHSISRLVGSPPGYVGHEEAGQLTEKVRRKPYSVILFDEIEKAHPDVFNIMLQILDDGRLTDSQGKTVDFKNAVIISTSNVGSNLIQSAAEKRFGFDSEDGSEKEKKTIEKSEHYEELKSQLMGELKKVFKPEFLNRIDEVIIFHSLEKKHIMHIIDLLLDEVGELLHGQNIRMTVDRKVKESILEDGYDPMFGARPLKRAIQRMIENPLSSMLLEGKFKSGDTIKVTLKKDGKEFAFEKATLPAIKTKPKKVSETVET